jgi:hypothetical protein
MGALVTAAIALGAIYVIVAFFAPNPLVRIALRSLPVLPVAIWTLWFDRSRPFERQAAPIRTVGRIGLLLLTMALAITLLGLGLNWIYDPNRIL